MRLVSYRAEAAGAAATRLGAVFGGAEVVELRAALAAAIAAAGEPDRSAELIPSDMSAFLAVGEEAMVAATRGLAFAVAPGREGLRRPLAAAEPLAPVARPGKILGVGRNYGAHANEVGGPRQAAPRIFLKPASAVAPPRCTVRIPAAVSKPDYKAELAVVIGRPAREVLRSGVRGGLHRPRRRQRAGVPARRLAAADLLRQAHGRLLPDGTLARHAGGGGRALEPAGALLAQRRAGSGREHAGHDLPGPNVDRLSQPVREAEAGDVIATGTPAGSGAFRDPPRWLRPGDRLRLEVERVGVLEHAFA